jgi:hypothetical protein
MPSTVINRATANSTAITTPIAAGPATTGWMNLAEMRTEVARRAGGRTDLDPAAIALHINEAYLDLCSMLQFEWMDATIEWSTVAGVAQYALPSAIREVVKISSVGDPDVDDDGPLEKVDMAEYRRMGREDSDLHSKPSAFTLSPDNVLVLWRTPDAIYSMSAEVMLRPARLTSDSHYPVYPEEWNEAVLTLAVSKAVGALREFELSAQLYNTYLGYVRSRRNERGERKRGTVGAIFIPRTAEELRRSTRRGY